jgi:CTP synthase (UTP-ammonia lyase)
MRVGLIGDRNDEHTAHRAIPVALSLAGAAIGVDVAPEWLPTETLAEAAHGTLEPFDLLWCVPASPYRSMEGALSAIRFARESGTPFLGTCGGFQHALIEFARNVVGIHDADHAETSPDATVQIVTPLSCALVEATGDVVFEQDSQLRRIYGADRVCETYRCSYAMNPAYEPVLAAKDLRFGARDPDGGVRACELASHPFFVAVLYQPERSAIRGETHPLIAEAVRVGANRRVSMAGRVPSLDVPRSSLPLQPGS